MSKWSVETPDDGDLVARARQGDRQAFAVLVGRHSAEIYNLAYRLTRHRELAADVAQETWIRTWRGLENFRGDAAFGTWVYRITVNTAATAKRKQLRHQTTDLDDAPEPEAPDSALPDRGVDQAELRQRIGRALRSLPPGLRAVVVMKDVHGWSHREIAAALGISTTAAKVRLHRAHQRLQRRLHEEPR
jgi:RNA polymerase sigma-70 factor (ECF subfamily)